MQLDGGSYGTAHASASAAGTAGRLDYSIGAARFSTDNRVPNSGFDSTTKGTSRSGTTEVG